jgi:hypothetical protein
MLLDIVFTAGVAYGAFWLGGKYQTLHALGAAIMNKLGKA